MVQPILAALLALLPQQSDTSTYANRATADLVARGQARHAAQDTLVHDYTAMVRTRVDAGFGRRRFAVIPPLFAMETAARITWAQPNDLKVQVEGVRVASSFRGARVTGTFDEPWFIPRGLGDSIRFVSDGIPETAAVHPLSARGPDLYRYAITDSLAITLPQRTVRAIGLRVDPKRLAPSLVAGEIWLDAETSEVVRMTVVFVGEYLWSTPEGATARDTSDALKENRLANRVLRVEAQMEYGLHEAKYWMPYRQLVTLTVDIPWFIGARIPVRFVSTFSDYQVNAGAVPKFTISPQEPGERRCRRRDREDWECADRRRSGEKAELGYTRAQGTGDGGRWEVAVPPRDSLIGYQWPDQLTLQPDAATEELIRETSEKLAQIDRTLPAVWMGRQVLGLAWDRFSDLFRFNRVQGPSLGTGFRLELGPAFTAMLGSARFGFTDHRVTGSLLLRRDAPAGRFEIGAWREVREVEPWTGGLGFGNSINALFAGHDDADYRLALGGGMTLAANHGPLQDVELEAGFERHRPMVTVAGSRINDWLGGSGVFQPNPAVTSGDYFRGRITIPRRIGPARVSLGLEGVAGSGLSAARGWGEITTRFAVVGRSGAVTLRGGAAVGDSLPQMRFRLGGPATVRGYTYGSRTVTNVWAAQLDFGLSRRSALSPVVFVDVGNGSGGGDPLLSVGAGVSLLEGLIRLNWAKGLNPGAPVRFDLLFRAPR